MTDDDAGNHNQNHHDDAGNHNHDDDDDEEDSWIQLDCTCLLYINSFLQAKCYPKFQD